MCNGAYGAEERGLRDDPNDRLTVRCAVLHVFLCFGTKIMLGLILALY